MEIGSAAASDNTCSVYNAGLVPCILDLPKTDKAPSRGTRVAFFLVETYKLVSGVEDSAVREYPDDIPEVACCSKLEGHIAARVE